MPKDPVKRRVWKSSRIWWAVVPWSSWTYGFSSWSEAMGFCLGETRALPISLDYQ